MASPLRQIYDIYDNPAAEPKTQETPKFHVFEGIDNTDGVSFSELRYFIQLAGFCVLTVLLSFFFLAHNWSALIALPLAAAGSGLGVYSITYLIESIKN